VAEDTCKLTGADTWLAPLSGAADTAQGWLADRDAQRQSLVADLAAIQEALVEAIQVWQQYEDTEQPLGRGSGGWDPQDWPGARRKQALSALNARIHHLYKDAVGTVGLTSPTTDDHVLLEAARQCLDPANEDSGAEAARAAIRRLNDENAKLSLLCQGLAGA